jgi:hypothetical protein
MLEDNPKQNFPLNSYFELSLSITSLYFHLKIIVPKRDVWRFNISVNALEHRRPGGICSPGFAIPINEEFFIL